MTKLTVTQRKLVLEAVTARKLAAHRQLLDTTDTLVRSRLAHLIANLMAGEEYVSNLRTRPDPR